MPTTLPASMAAVLLLVGLAAVGSLVQRRWGVKTADPLDSVWAWIAGRARSLAGLLSLDAATRAARSITIGAARARERADAWVQAALDQVRAVASSREMTQALEGVGVMLVSDPDERRRGLFRRRRERPEAEEGEPEAEAAEPGEPEAGGHALRSEDAVPAETAEAPAPVEAFAPQAPAARRARPRPKLNYIPLEPSDREETSEDEQATLRARLRRGLRKTRDYLNRDVREVFGAGPVPEAFDSLEEILVRADVGVATAMALSEELRERGRELTSDTLAQALRDSMRHQLKDADRRLRVNDDGLSVWLVVGVNGSGKTTACAKLAAHATHQGFSVCLAAADTFRAAAIEQLETWAQRLGVDLVRQHQGADPAAVVFDAIGHARARGHDLVIADTAGRLHTRVPLMEELRKVRRVVERDGGLLTETLLVLDATTGQNGIVQARAFQEAVDVTGLVLAKLDGTAKGGIVIAVERELGIPVKAVGVGERADDIAPFDPDAFVDAMFA